ncbi:unnamed protein product, partial [marine sediment metagenome]
TLTADAVTALTTFAIFHEAVSLVPQPAARTKTSRHKETNLQPNDCLSTPVLREEQNWYISPTPSRRRLALVAARF